MTQPDAEKWRSGCTCNRVGLCYRCQAASEIERLAARVAELEASLAIYKGRDDGKQLVINQLERASHEQNMPQDTCRACQGKGWVLGYGLLRHYCTEPGCKAGAEFFRQTFGTEPPQAAKPNVSLAYVVGKYIHDHCKDVPHDIGLRIMELIGGELFEAQKPPQPPNDELVAAARAVVARWETPAWKVAPATAGYIYALRDALDRYAHQAPAAARNHVAWLIESIDNGKAYWWRGSDFTDDANEAVRFSRREDADQVILERGMDDSFSAEHMWCDVPSPTKESGL